MLRDVLDLLAPAAVVHSECIDPTLAREPVETRLDDPQQGPVAMLCNVNSTSVGSSPE